MTARAAKVRVAAKRRVTFGDDKKSWRTDMKSQFATLQKPGRLPTSNCPHKVEGRNVLHFAYYSSSFKVNHIALVFQPTIEKVKYLFLDTKRLMSASLDQDEKGKQTLGPPP